LLQIFGPFPMAAITSSSEELYLMIIFQHMIPRKHWLYPSSIKLQYRL